PDAPGRAERRGDRARARPVHARRSADPRGQHGRAARAAHAGGAPVSTSTAWVLVGLCAVITAAIKAAGPVALGGRRLPERFQHVVALMAPALLGALVCGAAFSHGHHLGAGAPTAGVATARCAPWRGPPVRRG